MNGPLRIIFSVAVLVMWASFGWSLAHGNWSPVLWGVLLAAHAACAVVFYNFPYIFSYGYAISVLVCNLIIVARYPSLPALLVGGACVLYGLRLWQFIHARNREASFRGNADRADAAGASAPMGLKISVWIMVSWLMAYQAMTTWNVARSAELTPWLIVGTVIMLAGLALETAADAQKLAAKRKQPGRWVSDGLYRRIRHPNYLGEIIFQVGLVLAGLASFGTPAGLIAAIVAPLYIVALMWYASEELDAKQLARYSSDPDYQRHRAGTARLLPGLA